MFLEALSGTSRFFVSGFVAASPNGEVFLRGRDKDQMLEATSARLWAAWEVGWVVVGGLRTEAGDPDREDGIKSLIWHGGFACNINIQRDYALVPEAKDREDMEDESELVERMILREVRRCGCLLFVCNGLEINLR